MVYTILITSCQQDVLTDEDTLLQNSIEADESIIESDVYVVPKGLENESAEYTISYLSSLSDDELKKLKNNHRIQTFLELEGLYTSVYSQLKEGDLFIDIDLEHHLTSQQLNRLAEFSVSDAISVRCGGYPMYNCHNPQWCGSKDHIATNCYSGNWYCSSSTPGETVKQQYCGYPHGVRVRWHLYPCHSACP